MATKPLTYASLLLMTSALCTPAALAQTTGQTATPTAPASTTSPTAGPPEEAAADAEQGVDISIPGGGSSEGEEIVVTGRNIPNIVKATPEVVSVLSTADIARTGEGDIAGALSRVTGLSVVGDGFVYVRGLGDRYSLSLLNGSPLPSPEPLRRVVPLDIFPSRIIASALVQKSYSPNYPGEFGGGVINLTTIAAPREPFFEVGVGISGDTETTGKLGYTYFGSDTDVLGYDNGPRDTPGIINAAGANGLSVSTANAARLTNAATTVLQRNFDIPANASGNVTLGTVIEDLAGGRLGVVASGGYSNSWVTRDALQQSAGDNTGDVQRGFRTVLTDNRILVNGLIGFGFDVEDHKFRITNLYIHDTVKQGRLSSGFDATISTPDPSLPDPIIEQNTFFFERELYDLQGVAELQFGDLGVDFRGTYANTRRNSPYERGFVYSYNPVIGDYQNNLGGSAQQATIAFSELEEDLYAGGADVTYELPFSRPASVSAGFAYNKTERTSTRYSFQYRGANNSPVNGIVAQLRPDGLLSDISIITNGITLQNTSADSGAARYDAALEIYAGYAMAEAELLDGLRITGGVRYEDADQTVTTGGAFAGTALSNDYWLPSATLTYNFAENLQLRLHASKTIARPQFRELAPQLYQDFTSDRQFFGNPFLTDSELKNAEARLEWFFARDQRLTVAGFYKQIDRPIETVATSLPNSQILTGFSNAPKADLYGGEIEFQYYQPLETLGDAFATRRLVLIGNYTYSKSELKIGNEQVASPISSAGGVTLLPANVLFQDGAPLTGQSDHLVNVQIGFEDTERLSQATLLFTYASERVTNRGPISSGVRLPDLVEKPGIRLDFVAREAVQFLGTELEVKFEARNITGTKYQEFQSFSNNARVDVNSYDVGTSFSLGVAAKF